MSFTPRYSYTAISSRPAATWPGGRRLAVYLALNVEQYSYGEGLVEDLVPGMPQPDVLNTSWRDYGTRVGAWRLLDLFRETATPATILLNSRVCDAAPDLVARMVADGHEIAAHGRSNSESLADCSAEEEAVVIAEVTARIAEASGQRPQGWLSPWLAETRITPDLLQEDGYRYLLDFCCDDQPIWLTTRSGRLLALPYSQEINDSTAIIGRQASAAEFADMAIDQIDEMLDQPGPAPLVFGLALHGNIIGQPFRIRQLRRVLTHLHGLRDRVWVAPAADIAAAVHADPDKFV
ncbi:polysaccharide deacetylase family protein [Fluviibacterium sp. DFM31]|uniref:Chitooligosaccharide deacetylase n=1 Tax=Meridianimarinicoccus marinus TaxID=3231483 RepID=A0ABV3L7Z0_9RHOB